MGAMRNDSTNATTLTARLWASCLIFTSSRFTNLFGR